MLRQEYFENSASQFGIGLRYLITTDKSSVQKLESRASKIEETYTSNIIRDLNAPVECVFNTVCNSSFVLFIHKTYITPTMSFDIPEINMCDHLKVTFIFLTHEDVKEVRMVCRTNFTCNIILKLESQYIEMAGKHSMR